MAVRIPADLDRPATHKDTARDAIGGVIVQDVLSRLPERDAVLLRADHVEGWTISELAKATGKGRNSINVRERLRHMLEGQRIEKKPKKR